MVPRAVLIFLFYTFSLEFNKVLQYESRTISLFSVPVHYFLLKNFVAKLECFESHPMFWNALWHSCVTLGRKSFIQYKYVLFMHEKIQELKYSVIAQFKWMHTPFSYFSRTSSLMLVVQEYCEYLASTYISNSQKTPKKVCS